MVRCDLSGDKRWLWRLEHQMKVIAHQTIRMHLPTSLCACLPKRSYETSAVFIIPKDGFFAIPSTQQMVNRPVLFHEKLHRHQQN